MVSKLGFGLFIPDPDPDPDFLPIPYPGVKKALDPGSGSATLDQWEAESRNVDHVIS